MGADRRPLAKRYRSRSRLSESRHVSERYHGYPIPVCQAEVRHLQ